MCFLFDDEALRHCPPYFNLGVLAAPAATMRRIGSVIYDLMAAADAVHRTNFRAQIAVSLAVTRLALPFRALPVRWNFANDPLLEALHASELGDVRIIHLRVSNALAQQLLGGLHPRVKAEDAARPRA